MKTGVHYGLDYAVYRTLPTHCHSEICAMVVDATVPLYPRGFRGHFQGNGVLCAENEGESRDDECIAVSKRKFEGDEGEKSKVRRDVDGNKNICQHDNEEHGGVKLRSQRGENDREDRAGR